LKYDFIKVQEDLEEMGKDQEAYKSKVRGTLDDKL
jgi:hypothetical protein